MNEAEKIAWADLLAQADVLKEMLEEGRLEDIVELSATIQSSCQEFFLSIDKKGADNISFLQKEGVRLMGILAQANQLALGRQVDVRKEAAKMSHGTKGISAYKKT